MGPELTYAPGATPLDPDFMRNLHRRMLGKTWRWAGDFRTTEKNIGVAPEHIAVELHKLTADIRYQLEFNAFPILELAARFHHRLVWVHPFANGNGRFARLMTDLLLARNDQQPFSWGRGDLVAAGEVRDRYISALRAADARDYGLLLEFVQVN
jgi:Fic-DOC domain mobile mystery protein B